MQETSISWCTHTWNPSHGCSKISSGCENCYAEEQSLEMGHTKSEWSPENADENVTVKPHKLSEPKDLDKEAEIFVNSMSDLFHKNIPETFIRKVFRIMRNTPHHIYMILTKRPRRAAKIDIEWPPNVWIGTSVEGKHVTKRIDTLKEIDADVRFISFEPLIESVGKVDLSHIDWCIVGGESADDKNRREMDHSWARLIRHQCKRDNAKFYFKQSSAKFPETGTKLRVLDRNDMKYVHEEIQHKPNPNTAVTRAREDLNNTEQTTLTNL